MESLFPQRGQRVEQGARPDNLSRGKRPVVLNVERLVSIVKGAPITGLISVNGYQGNDNLFYFGKGKGVVIPNDGLTSSFSDVFVDHAGLSFSTASTSANLFTSDGAYVFGNSAGVTVFGNGTFTATTAVSTPEPGSLALLGTGLLGLFFVFRRQRFGV